MFFGILINTYPPGHADPAVRPDFGVMAVLMSVTSRAGQVPMGARLNRFKKGMHLGSGLRDHAHRDPLEKLF